MWLLNSGDMQRGLWIIKYMDTSSRVKDKSNKNGVRGDYTTLRGPELAEDQIPGLASVSMDHCPDIVFWINSEARIVYVNKTACRLLGYTHDELLSLSLYDIDENIQPEMWDEAWRFTRENGVNCMETVQRTKDGRSIPVEMSATIIEFQDQPFICAFIREISLRIKAETALRESEATMRSIFRAAPIGIGMLADRVFKKLNDRMCAMLGYTREELIGHKTRILYRSDDHFDSVGAEIYQQSKRADIGTLETQWVRKDGQLIDVILCLSAIDSDNPDAGVMFTALDNTDRNRFEKVKTTLLEISQATSNVESLDDLLLTIHQTLGRLIDTTNFYVALYNAETGKYSFPFIRDRFYTKAEISPAEMKKSLTDFVRRTGYPILVNREVHALLTARGEIIQVGQPSQIWLGAPLKTQNGTIGVVVVQDYDNPDAYTEAEMEILSFVSDHIAMSIERKWSEEQLMIEKAHFERLFESSPEAIVVVDTFCRIVRFNSAFTTIFGYTEDDGLGHNIDELIAPDDFRQEAQDLTDRVKHGEQVSLEGRRRRKDGTLVDISLLAIPVRIDDEQVAMYAIYRDITDRIRAKAHENELQEKLVRAERMESLGVLAGGVAHDLNNMLGPLVGYPELILAKLPEDSPIRKQIGIIGKSAKDAADVIQDLLTLARRGRYEMQPVNVNDIITSYLESHSFHKLAEQRPEIVVTTNLDTTVEHIMGSSPHLSKIIMNLIVNAFDAMPSGGELAIETTQQEMRELLSGHHDLGGGEYILVRIRDTGTGIDPSDLEHIFEPYYSKKALGTSGSGLGLAVVYGIVKDHKGYYDVFSTVGQGTEFVIYLPVTTIYARKEIPTDIDLTGHETVLVIDDVAEQRELVSELLTTFGYKVHMATNGHEAVDFLKKQSVDLIILDMIMEKGFDGLDTYREIIRHRPGQKAVIVSGFSSTERVKETQKLGAGPFVKKPYTWDKLGSAIRAELNR